MELIIRKNKGGVNIFGMLDLAREKPLFALLLAKLLAQKGINSWFYTLNSINKRESTDLILDTAMPTSKLIDKIAGLVKRKNIKGDKRGNDKKTKS